MSGSVMTFRAAGPQDSEAVAEQHADSWRRHYRGAFADSFLDGDVLTFRRAVWAERLAARGPGDDADKPGDGRTPATTILAESDGELIGFIHVVFDDDDRWGSLVDNLHVVHGRKRGGIGSALITRATQAVDESGATKLMYLWVLEQNTAAQAFYSARGGRPVERTLVEPPEGNPGNLNGHPAKLRFAWPDVREVLAAG